MEKAMYPSKTIRITQRDHQGTHADCWATDEAGSDGGISSLFAPFTGIIKKIYSKDANEVWLESVEPVLFADGTKDYMTIMFCHDNDVSDLWVGKIIKKGEAFYQEGTKGYATGNHCHFECAKGKFTGTGWHKDAAGYWSINNGKLVTDCLFIDDSYNVIQTLGLNFRNVKEVEVKKYGTPVTRNEYVNQIKINADNVRARTSPSGEIIGYVNSGIYNSLEIVTQDGYDWHRVEDNLWCAMGEWAEWLPKKEKPAEEPKTDDTETKINELNATIEILNKQLSEKDEIINNLTSGTAELTNKIIDQDKIIKELKENLANAPKFIFESSKLDFYAIKLAEKEKLYIGN